MGYEDISVSLAIRYAIQDRWDDFKGLRPIRWIYWKIYHRRRRAKVWRNWERYEEILESIYAPWFDVSEKSNMIYFGHLDDLHCMFCGCHYVPFDDNKWENEEERQTHSPTCLWHKIEQLQQL